eukprot:2627222-Prymnesium_polylepis.3
MGAYIQAHVRASSQGYETQMMRRPSSCPSSAIISSRLDKSLQRKQLPRLHGAAIICHLDHMRCVQQRDRPLRRGPSRVPPRCTAQSSWAGVYGFSRAASAAAFTDASASLDDSASAAVAFTFSCAGAAATAPAP